MIVMPLCIIIACLFLFGVMLKHTRNRQRGVLVCIALFVYVFLIIFEQFYLENFYNMYFNFSDPGSYYLRTKGVGFIQLIDELYSSKVELSNWYYFILNWVFQVGFSNPTIYGISINIVNVMFFLSGYLLLCSKIVNNPGLIEFTMLFHPWALMLLIRNVRDAVIIFIVSLFLYLVSLDKLNKSQIVMIAASVVMMYFVRPFFVLPLILVVMIKNYQVVGGVQRNGLVFISLCVFSIFVYMNWSDLVVRTSSNYYGNALFFGRGSHEDIDILFNANLESGKFTYSSLDFFLKNIIISIPVFLFTPHPYNYLTNFINLSENGRYVIYTNFDNYLIVLGSIVNYFIFIPILLKSFVFIRYINIKLFVVPLFIALIYSIFLFGSADMRIRYTFIYFVFAAFVKSNISMYRSTNDIKYLIISFGIFFAIPLLSQ